MSTFVPNPAFIKIFERTLTHKKLKDEAAEKIAARARDIAPVDTGEYRDSIEVKDGEVVAGAKHSAVVEFGSSDTPTFAPLRKAATEEFGANALKRR